MRAYNVGKREPTALGSWWWLDYDATLWALAIVWYRKAKCAGLLIGPLKIGVRW